MATEKEDVIAPSSEIPLKRPVPEVTEEQVQVAAEKAEEIIPAAAPVKQAVVTKGDFMIQIAAIGDKSKAEAIWADVKKKNSSALSKLAPTYMAVDLGDKGVLYRVRGGMLETRKAADDVCAKLKSNNQNCLVVIK